MNSARSDLQARLADPALAGLAVGMRVLTSGKPAAAILEVVHGSRDASGDPPPVDLIAMETEARGTISRLFEGSVAGEVLGESPVPVLLDHTEDAPAE